MSEPIHVVGATGRSGSALCWALADRDIAFVPVVRDGAKFRASGLPGEPAIADLTDGFELGRALRDARRVVSCAHARHVPAILDAARSAEQFVFLGSTRRFSRWPDRHGAGVLSGEAALMGSGRSGVMLHPTMIYGAEGEDNVQRLAALLRRLPIVPLPGGGRALVQPIHQNDLTQCLLAALDIAWTEPRTLVVAGPTALPYADFVRHVAAAAGLPAPRIVPVPAGVLMAMAPIVSVLPFLPNVASAEIRRLLEDKAFPVGAMFSTLGVRGMPLERGLALTFGAGGPLGCRRRRHRDAL
jgi:uncharacterized protein YbjT (DUF2867 family)